MAPSVFNQKWPEVFYLPTAFGRAEFQICNIATDEVGDGVVTIASRNSDRHPIFLHTHRSLEEVRLFYPREVFDLAEGAKVLDLGCGTGQCVIDLRDKGVEAFGVDAFLPRTRRDMPYLKMSTFELAQYESASFDLIIATMSLVRGPSAKLSTTFLELPLGPGSSLGRDILQLSPGWEPSDETLNEIARVLKPGGRLYFFPLTQKSFDTHFGSHMKAYSGPLKLLPLDRNFPPPYPAFPNLTYGVIQKNE